MINKILLTITIGLIIVNLDMVWYNKKIKPKTDINTYTLLLTLYFISLPIQSLVLLGIGAFILNL